VAADDFIHAFDPVHLDGDSIAAFVHGGHLGADVNGNPLVGKDLPNGSADVLVFPGQKPRTRSRVDRVVGCIYRRSRYARWW